MRLAISNLAWDIGEDPAAAELLQAHGIDAIDVVPGKYFPDPEQAGDVAIARLRNWWAARGIEITGMQSLLFGTAGLNLFADAGVQLRMLRHLAAVCRLAAGLGARRLAFGSPRNRDRGALGDEAAFNVAVPFFQRLGDIAAAHGVTICLEPNPSRYGANFMTHCGDTARVVEAVGNPAIRLQLDSGAMAINGEDAETILDIWGSLVGHIHASEPDLVPLGDGGVDHGRLRVLFMRHLPRHVVTVEMLATTGEPHLAAIDRALAVARRAYGRWLPGVAA